MKSSGIAMLALSSILVTNTALANSSYVYREPLEGVVGIRELSEGVSQEQFQEKEVDLNSTVPVWDSSGLICSSTLSVNTSKENQTIDWYSSLGTLSNSSSMTDVDGLATTIISHDSPNTADLSATVRNTGYVGYNNVNFSVCFDYKLEHLEPVYDASTQRCHIDIKASTSGGGHTLDWEATRGTLDSNNTVSLNDGRSVVRLSSLNPDISTVSVDLKGIEKNIEIDFGACFGYWVSFAYQRGLSYTQDWSNLTWNSKGLNEFPTDPYPNSTPSNIDISHNDLTHIAGLSGITQTDSLDISSNKIQSIKPLSSLISVNSYIDISKNPFKSLDGLSNVTTIKGQLRATDLPNLVDISGLANITSLGETVNTSYSAHVFLDSGIVEREGFVPIPSDSWICQPSNGIEIIYQIRHNDGSITYDNDPDRIRGEVCG